MLKLGDPLFVSNRGQLVRFSVLEKKNKRRSASLVDLLDLSPSYTPLNEYYEDPTPPSFEPSTYNSHFDGYIE